MGTLIPDWLHGWFEHNQATHAAWLGAIGTTAAAALGVAAFIWQVVSSSRARGEARRAQARGVWLLLGEISTTFELPAATYTLGAEAIAVHNDSAEVITWVNVQLTPIYQAADGKVTRIQHEHTDENQTSQRVVMIGPKGRWDTDPVSIHVPDLGMEGTWLWECEVVFEDAAGARWARTGLSQELTKRPKSRAERKVDKEWVR